MEENYDNLNDFIKNYAINDKTNTAIMLTGAWGTGKSYYIKNTLVNKLKKYNIDCVIVSLYGITEISDISKTIYLDLRFKKIFTQKKKIKEFFTTIGLAVRNLFKYIKPTIQTPVFALSFDFDISMSDKDLKNVYQSIDLNNKIIIIEDLERCTIDIVDVLGFINNLVELNGIKILIVANEDEIIKYNTPTNTTEQCPKSDNADLIKRTKENKENELKHKKEVKQYNKGKENYTDDTLKYMRIKEKTISDTIKFMPILSVVISNIVDKFNNEILTDVINNLDTDFLKQLFEEDYIDKCTEFARQLAEEHNYIAKKIEDDNQNFILSRNKNFNFRTFEYACQKSRDIYIKFEKNYTYSIEYKICIFVSILRLAIKFKKGYKTNIININDVSLNQNALVYPVLEYIYEYIVNQSNFTKNDTMKYSENYQLYLLNNKNTIQNKDLEVLSNITWHYANDICDSIYNVEKLLKDDSIQYIVYIKLVRNLIEAKYIIGINIENCRKYIIKNLKNLKETTDISKLFHFDNDGINYNLYNKLDDAMKKYYDEFIKEIRDIIKENKSIHHNFYSGEEKTLDFFNNINFKIGEIMLQKTFSNKINVSHFCDTIICQSPKTISYVGYIFNRIYNEQTYNGVSPYNFFQNDKKNINSIINGLSTKMQNCDSDDIQKYCLQEFIEVLKDIESNL